MLADLTLDQSSEFSSLLAIGFVDLEKAFDSMLRNQLLKVLQDQYRIDPNTVKCTRKTYYGTTSYVPGAFRPLQMTMGVKQGAHCPYKLLDYS